MTHEPVAVSRLTLVHHADAVGPDVDARRPLSPRGTVQAAALSARARDLGIRPDAIWHSGKLRARQTAEAYLGACNPLAQFRMVRGLRPDDPPDVIRVEIEADERELLVVGHMPLLPALLRQLDPRAAAFPTNGFVVLERTGEGGWIERGRGEL
jgi:phosphohistidine phosphatase